MNDDAVPVKVCTKCGRTLPETDFYAIASHTNRRRADCKACVNAAVRAAKQRRRERMGEEAYLAAERDKVRRHRERTGNATGKRYEAARRAAIAALIDRHRDEFDALLSKAEGER